MSVVVQKFGGTSLGSLDRIRHVGRRCLATRARGEDLVVVVSAMAGETDRLLSLARQMECPELACEGDLMVATGKTPSQLIEYLYSLVGPHYYDRVDLHYPDDQRDQIIGRVAERRSKVDGRDVTRQEVFGGNGAPIAGVRYFCQDGSWLLVRFSGTEPVLRIYAECPSPEAVQELLAAGREMAGL